MNVDIFFYFYNDAMNVILSMMGKNNKIRLFLFYRSIVFLVRHVFVLKTHWLAQTFLIKNKKWNKMFFVNKT